MKAPCEWSKMCIDGCVVLFVHWCTPVNKHVEYLSPIKKYRFNNKQVSTHFTCHIIECLSNKIPILSALSTKIPYHVYIYIEQLVHLCFIWFIWFHLGAPTSNLPPTTSIGSPWNRLWNSMWDFVWSSKLLNQQTATNQVVNHPGKNTDQNPFNKTRAKTIGR